MEPFVPASCCTGRRRNARGQPCRRAPREPQTISASGTEFESLLAQEVPHLRRYARALCGRPDAADDLVQDCLERALRKRRLWRPDGRLRSWLLRMLYRLYLNARKRGALERRTLDRARERAAEQTPPSAVDERAECRDVIRALDDLPAEQRAAIVLVALEDVNYQEAAWILGIRVGTLRSRLSRGREALRHACGDSDSAPTLRRVK